MSARILAFVPALGLVSETFITDTLAGFVRAGAQLSVAAGSIHEKTVAAGAEIIAAPFLHLHRPADRLAARLRPGPLWSAMRDTKLDHNATQVVHAILQKHRPDVAYVEYGFAFARVARPLRAAGVPVVVHLHGHDITAALGEPGYREALAASLAEAAAVVVASQHMRRLAILAGAAPEHVAVVPLGITLEGNVPMPWAERRRLTPSVAFLGRLVPKKHPVALIEAFAQVHHARPEAHLHLIGDGPEREATEARAATRRVAGAITFHGALPRAAALAIVRRAWIYAQHSVTSWTGDQEGFGISIAEAAALKLPVVSTRHNGIPEQVVDGETGLLVPEYDFEAMAAAILDLLANPDRCEALGTAARERVLASYPPEARTERLLAILERAVPS